MELGISPILTADWTLHFLIGLKIIDFNKYLQEDYNRLDVASKFLGILITMTESGLCIYTG